METPPVPNSTPELLFHVTLAVIDYHIDASGGARSFYVLGTFAELSAARSFAAEKALPGLGYELDDFTTYEANPRAVGGPGALDGWNHGDGVVVYAKAPAGQVFVVGVDTKPNGEGLPEDGAGGLRLPGDEGEGAQGRTGLHYVVQSCVDYNADRSGAARTDEVQGAFVHRADAVDAARNALFAEGELGKGDFAEFDERDDESEKGQWPFGEDVVVHAVANTGENFELSVVTVPGAHRRHAKKRGERKH